MLIALGVPKRDVQRSNVVGATDLARPTTGVNDVNMKTAANAPKLDTMGGVQRGDPRLTSPRADGGAS